MPAKKKVAAKKKTAAKKTGAKKKATTKSTPGTRRTAAAKKGSAPKQLAKYQKMRDFTKTKEPAGGGDAPAKGKLRFVVQKHQASHLHFDFRLEAEGVMKSWAVPKGPSMNPGDKRLAMEVEDHPIEYNKFEGTIPQGQYGGGTVMLWDKGTYVPLGGTGKASDSDIVTQAIKKGELKFTMFGERLHGEFVLVRMKGRGSPSKPQWLLIKHRDDFANVHALLQRLEAGRTSLLHRYDLAVDDEIST